MNGEVTRHTRTTNIVCTRGYTGETEPETCNLSSGHWLRSRLWRAIVIATSARSLTSEQPIRPYIPKLGRFLIVVTFLEGEWLTMLSCVADAQMRSAF